MPVITQCPNCRKKLQAPDNRVGTTAKCPQCRTPFQIQPVSTGPAGRSESNVAGRSSRPSAAAQPVATPISSQPAAPQPTQPDVWYVQTSDGTDYGPVSHADLAQWILEERIDSDCQLLQEGWSQWKWADDVFPQLADTGQVKGAASPFAGIVDPGPTTPSYAVRDSRGQKAAGQPSGGKQETSAASQSLQRVDAGLKIAFVSLIVSTAGFFLAYVGIFGSIQTLVGMLGTGPQASEIKAITILMIWGASAMLGGLAAHFAGLCTCMASPKSFGGSQQIAVSVAAFGVFVFLSHSPILLAAAEVKSSLGYKAVFWLAFMAQKVSFVALAFYLAVFAKHAPNKKLDTHALAYASVEGASAVWLTVVMLEAISPESVNPKLILAIFMIFGLITYAYMIFLISAARQALKRV